MTSVELQEEEMDTSPQDIFTVNKQPGQKPRQQESADESDDMGEADSRENSENSDNDSVSALKGLRTKERGGNGVKNSGHVSSDESSGDDDDDKDVDIFTVATAKAAVANASILTNAS